MALPTKVRLTVAVQRGRQGKEDIGSWSWEWELDIWFSGGAIGTLLDCLCRRGNLLPTIFSTDPSFSLDWVGEVFVCRLLLLFDGCQQDYFLTQTCTDGRIYVYIEQCRNTRMISLWIFWFFGEFCQISRCKFVRFLCATFWISGWKFWDFLEKLLDFSLHRCVGHPSGAKDKVKQARRAKVGRNGR